MALSTRRKGSGDSAVLTIDHIRQMLFALIIIILIVFLLSIPAQGAPPVMEKTAKILDCLKWDVSSCLSLVRFW